VSAGIFPASNPWVQPVFHYQFFAGTDFPVEHFSFTGNFETKCKHIALKY
jgi:hypothetical protein